MGRNLVGTRHLTIHLQRRTRMTLSLIAHVAVNVYVAVAGVVTASLSV